MKVGLLVAAMLVTATACAADTTIFGFELGKPLVLPECPHKTLGSIPRKMYSAIPPMTCAQDAHELNGYGKPVREIVFSEKETPSIVKNWRAFPLEVGGNLVGFHFITDGAEAQSAVMAALQKKYGKPEYSKTHGVQNSFGAQFDAVDASWHSGPVQVMYMGVLDRVDVGQVYIDLPEAVELRRSWNKAATVSERKM